MAMAKRVYICGNEEVRDDNMPYRFLEKLRHDFGKIEYAIFDPTENFPDDDPLYIVDVVMGAERVVVIDALRSWLMRRAYPCMMPIWLFI